MGIREGRVSGGPHWPVSLPQYIVVGTYSSNDDDDNDSNNNVNNFQKKNGPLPV